MLSKAATKQEAEPWIPEGEEPTGGGQMPEFRWGFKILADKLGASVVGAPITEEDYDSHSDSRQYTTKGKMEWSKNANVCFFFPAALPKA